MLNGSAPSRILLTTDTVGGVWRYSLEIAAGFAAHGAAVTLVTMGPAPSGGQCAEVAGLAGVELLQTTLPLDWLAENAAELAQASHALATIAQQCGAEIGPVAHAGSGHSRLARSRSSRWCIPASPPGGEPCMPPRHCRPTWHGGPHALRADWTCADAVIAPSQAFAAALRETTARPGIFMRYPNGRRMARLPRAPHPQVLAAGRLWDEGKNIVALDKAAGELDAPVRAAGPVRGPNGACISVHNLHLLGPLNDAALAQEYAHAAVFVSPARYEPFGLAVLEAAQTGVALVLSDIPTFRQLWDGAALFVHPDDPTALAQTLRHCCAPDRCAALGESARARAHRYTVERMVTATWSVHCNLWRARGGTRPRHAA